MEPECGNRHDDDDYNALDDDDDDYEFDDYHDHGKMR